MVKRKGAFTLIELLVVIAIIAILAAILFPVFAQAKVAAKRTADLSNIKQIALATLIYSNDTDDVLPHHNEYESYIIAARLMPYVKSRDLFRNPNATFSYGTVQHKQANNGVSDYMLPPDDGCVGLGTSTVGPKPNYYRDIYPAMDYQWTESLSEGAGGCNGAYGWYKRAFSATDGRVNNPSKVVLFVDYPSLGTQWPGGPGGTSESFWGVNFKGFFNEGSNVGHLDGHAKYYKSSRLYPKGVEWSGDLTEWPAWGFTWGNPDVQ